MQWNEGGDKMSKRSKSKRFMKQSADAVTAKDERKRNVRTMAEAEKIHEKEV